MTQISANSSVITLINVFTVEPANQRRLVELLTEATEVSVRQAPGFVSASLHRSTDGTKVTMYAQWRSIDEYQAMRRDPAPLPFFQEALTIAKFEPGMGAAFAHSLFKERPYGRFYLTLLLSPTLRFPLEY
jgi:quinol monooxygenase YgiN